VACQVGGAFVFVAVVYISGGAFGAEMDTLPCLKCSNKTFSFAIRIGNLHYNIKVDFIMADKQRTSWLKWYDAHKDEYNERRSRERDAKRGFVSSDSKHRKRDGPHENPNVKVRGRMTDIEKRRRKIELDLAKVERKKADWLTQNSKPDQQVSIREE
jgi:hypothetical protein